MNELERDILACTYALDRFSIHSLRDLCHMSLPSPHDISQEDVASVLQKYSKYFRLLSSEPESFEADPRLSAELLSRIHQYDIAMQFCPENIRKQQEAVEAGNAGWELYAAEHTLHDILRNPAASPSSLTGIIRADIIWTGLQDLEESKHRIQEIIFLEDPAVRDLTRKTKEIERGFIEELKKLSVPPEELDSFLSAAVDSFKNHFPHSEAALHWVQTTPGLPDLNARFRLADGLRSLERIEHYLIPLRHSQDPILVDIQKNMEKLKKQLLEEFVARKGS